MMITISLAALSLFAPLQQGPADASTLGPGRLPESWQSVSWELTDRQPLQLPEGSRLISRTQRFLQDGSLLLKLSDDPRVMLFRPDASLHREWTAPEGHGYWERISFGRFVGEDESFAWFLPGEYRTLPAEDLAYRLWRDAGDDDPEFMELPCRRIIAAEGGYWVARDKQLIFLDEGFHSLGAAMNAEGKPVRFEHVAQLRVDSSGTLTVLDGRPALPSCAEPAPPAVPYRVHLVSRQRRVLRTIELPLALRRNVGGFDFEGQMLMLNGYIRVIGASAKETNALYEVNLETLAWKRVHLSDEAFACFGRDGARLLDGGCTLKAFDFTDGSIATYRRASD